MMAVVLVLMMVFAIAGTFVSLILFIASGRASTGAFAFLFAVAAILSGRAVF